MEVPVFAESSPEIRRVASIECMKSAWVRSGEWKVLKCDASTPLPSSFRAKAAPYEAFPASGQSSLVEEANQCCRHFTNSSPSGSPFTVMSHAGSLSLRQGWQSRSESVARQNTAGLRRCTRQQDSGRKPTLITTIRKPADSDTALAGTMVVVSFTRSKPSMVTVLLFRS